MGKEEARRYVRRLVEAKDYIETHKFEVIVLGKETTPNDPLLRDHHDDYEKHKQENEAMKIMLADKLKELDEDQR